MQGSKPVIFRLKFLRFERRDGIVVGYVPHRKKAHRIQFKGRISGDPMQSSCYCNSISVANAIALFERQRVERYQMQVRRERDHELFRLFIHRREDWIDEAAAKLEPGALFIGLY